MNRILLIIASIFLIPAALLEYFVLFWTWAGGGAFTLIAVPAFFLLFLLVQLHFCRRSPKKQFRTFCMILSTPILAVCACYALAWLCGIEIVIW